MRGQDYWIGQTLGGRYKIEALLGQGGMGAVYRATDPNLERTVAIKLIDPRYSADKQFVHRFKTEAKAIARLRYPNIVQVFDFNNDNDTYYMVLEFVRGETLETKLKELKYRRHRLSLLETISITTDICDAVAYAHQRQMIHRDIKPGNVMITPEGQAFLMDFGIVKIMGEKQHTSTGATIGTAHYMSPEQAQGQKDIDGRTDIYAIGVMLFEMAAGRRPFEADSKVAVYVKHVNEPVPSLHQYAEGLSNNFVSIVEKALAKNRDDRFQSAEEMKSALQTITSNVKPNVLSFDSWIGKKIGGRYQIEDRLGHGGIGTVYKGTDPNLGREVAIKLFRASLSDDENFISRFEIEAKTISQFRHPNIVKVYDFNHDDETYFMVLEFLPGETLQHKLNELNRRQQRLPLADTIGITISICEAIAYVHAREIIHRNIKPANVMITPDGQPFLMDSGITKILAGIIGTPQYMSPEQAQGHAIDGRTDIYAIGVMLFEMVTGRRPYDANSKAAVLVKHINNPLPDIRQIIPDLPEELINIIEKALAKDPSDRFQSAEEMKATLQALSASIKPKAFSAQPDSTTGAIGDIPTVASSASSLKLDRDAVSDPAVELNEYQKARVNGLVDLKRLRYIAKDNVKLEPDILKQIDDVVERLETHRFSVAVVGEFKRGKSTFINALLGKEILPSDVLPCTATRCRVTYSLKPSVEIVYKGEAGQTGRIKEIGINQLTDYVTKLTVESEETAANIEETTIYYPFEAIRNGIDVIDTLGFSDDQVMLDVTLDLIPSVDAAILVMMADAPFFQSEFEFLNNQILLKDIGRIIFVINAIDRIRSKDEQRLVLEAISKRIIASVEKRLAKQFGKDSDEYNFYKKQIGTPKIYGLSSLQALTAKVESNPELLKQSGFPEFETVLDKFLAETRGTVELKVLAGQTIAASDEILKILRSESDNLESELMNLALETGRPAITISEHQLAESKELQREVENIRNKALWLLDSLSEID